MTSRERLWRIVILTVVLLGLSSAFLVSIGAEEEPGVATAFALAIGAVIRGRWRRWAPEGPGAPGQP